MPLVVHAVFPDRDEVQKRLVDGRGVEAAVCYHLHRLRGNRKDTWAVTVRANYRVTWKVDRDGAFVDVDYEDYH